MYFDTSPAKIAQAPPLPRHNSSNSPPPIISRSAMASRSLTSLTKSQLVDLIGQLTLENDRHGAAAASESFGDFGDVSSSRGSHSRAGGRGAASKTHGALGGSLGGIPESSGVASESVSHTWGGDREDREVSSSPSPAPSASRPPSKGRRASKAASSGPEYDPSRSGCMPSTLAEYVAADVEEDLKSVPGIGDKAKERLNAVGITTTHQLLAKFLSFHTKVSVCVLHVCRGFLSGDSQSALCLLAGRNDAGHVQRHDRLPGRGRYLQPPLDRGAGSRREGQACPRAPVPPCSTLCATLGHGVRVLCSSPRGFPASTTKVHLMYAVRRRERWWLGLSAKMNPKFA